MKSRLTILLSIVCFALSSSAGYSLPAEYDLVDLHGKKVKPKLDSMTKDHRLVMFWGLWCGICKKKLRKDLPEMQKNTNIDVITVNMDEADKATQSNLLHYVETKAKVKVPVFRETAGFVAKNMGITTSPYWALYKRVKTKGKPDSWLLLKKASGFKKKLILGLSSNAESAAPKKSKG
jgi:thiol-disulfide isomerase/thioredoxin